MRILGIDYGSKRVGIALSDEQGNLAYPHSVIANTKKLIDEILKICAKDRVGKVVLGRSLDYKMKPNAIMADIETFKSELEVASGLPVEYENEFLTSAEAERFQGKTNKLDASAAAIILRSYLDKTSLADK